MSWALFHFVEEPAEKWWRKHTPKRFLRKKDGVPASPPPRVETEPVEKEQPAPV
jgi:hypothetical protein